jgi:adenylosuccinate lyase
MRAWQGEAPFRELLAADPQVQSRLGPAKLGGLFNLDHALQHIPAILERALSAPT